MLSEKLKKAVVILREKAKDEHEFSFCFPNPVQREEIQKESAELYALAHDLEEIAKKMDKENCAL